MKEQESVFGAWCRLLRIPNFFTVPGDVLAGFVLAEGTREGVGRLGWGILLSFCLYAIGIVLNDVADLEEDRRDRPSRPLPSGAVPVIQARVAVMGLLLASACIIAAPLRSAAVPATALAATVLAYDLGLKRVVLLGEFTMGACRALNVLLGARVATGEGVTLPVTFGCAVVFAYVFCLALLARHEVNLGAARWVGRLVRGLILVQALLIAGAGQLLLSLPVAALWVPATWLGRRYHSS